MTNKKSSILITGCSAGGAGHALALQFASRGWRVFATARSTRSLTDLETKGIETLALDVTSSESIALLKQEITKRTGGKLNILFNNAGALYEVPAIEADSDQVRKLFDTNVLGLFDVVSAFAPLLLSAVPDADTPPMIVNTASVLARIPHPFSAAYNASKAAVASYSDTLRLEVAPLGIKVVTVFMGEVSTGMMTPSKVTFGLGSLYADVEEKVKARSKNHVDSSMKPEEFAKQVVKELLDRSGGLGRGELIWKGTNAFAVWFFDSIGWRKIIDRNLKSAVGLADREIRQLIFNRGQDKVKALAATTI